MSRLVILLIFLIMSPAVCAETCDLKLQIGEADTCSDYKIKHEGWEAGDKGSYQIAHFHLWRLSPYADLGSDSIDLWNEAEGKYYDDNGLRVRYVGRSTYPDRAKYILTPPQKIVIKGNLYYRDRNLNLAPAKWVSVHIWEQDPGVNDDDLLGSVLTDEFGYFEFGSVANIDLDDDGGKIDIIIQFVAGSTIGCMQDADNETYNLWQGTYRNVSGDIHAAWQIPDDETQYKAWWAYANICEGWSYLADTAGYTMPGVVVYWQWGHDADYLGSGSPNTHAALNPSVPARIHLDGRKGKGDGGGSANDPDIIIHEYGHCVMYKVFGNYMPPSPNCDPHYMNRNSGAGCAWAEGWAYFLPLAVFGDKYYTDTTYGVGISTFGTDTANLETRNGVLNFPDGDLCEGNVAAALWDMIDSNNEDYDDMTVDFSEIWDVLQDRTSDEDNFREFYNSWCALGHDKSKANAAIFQNRISYNEPPCADIDMPESLHGYAEKVRIGVWTEDTDGVLPDVAIFYTQNNIDWYQIIITISSQDRYSTLGEWQHVDWNTSEYIDEDDSVWMRVTVTDELGASSDATTGQFTVDNVAPHHWQNFAPPDWIADQTPDCTIRAKDITAGLDVSETRYNYSTDGGSTWSGWMSASCTGSDGTTTYQTITASAVPFNQDSGTRNKIKFKIDDAVGNTGESGEYTVKIGGEASATDAVIALRIAAGSHEYDAYYDVSGDGRVTSLDALMLLHSHHKTN